MSGERDALTDLRGRLDKAARTLDESASAHWEGTERTRLRGMAQGVRLALSYVDEAVRTSVTPPADGHAS